MVKKLTPAQRRALEVLAAGGVILHSPGIRGTGVRYELVAKGDLFGEDISAATFSSLTRNPFSRHEYWGMPELIECAPSDDGFPHMGPTPYRITDAGREALAN